MPTRRLAAAQPEQQTVWDIASVLTPDMKCKGTIHREVSRTAENKPQNQMAHEHLKHKGEQNRFFHLKINKITTNLWRSPSSLSHFLLE
jgi:hypothetical protein